MLSATPELIVTARFTNSAELHSRKFLLITIESVKEKVRAFAAGDREMERGMPGDDGRPFQG
jgi:hypothetical protein